MVIVGVDLYMFLTLLVLHETTFNIRYVSTTILSHDLLFFDILHQLLQTRVYIQRVLLLVEFTQIIMKTHTLGFLATILLQIVVTL